MRGGGEVFGGDGRRVGGWRHGECRYVSMYVWWFVGGGVEYWDGKVMVALGWFG